MTERTLDNPVPILFFCATRVSRPILDRRSCNPYSEMVCMLFLPLICGLQAARQKLAVII